MTTTTLLMYMTTGEVALAAIVIAVYLVIRARKAKHARVNSKVSRKVAINKPAPEATGPNLASHIQDLIRHTRKRLNSSDDENSRVLEARIQFLEAEAALLADDPKQDSYWSKVQKQLKSLFPSAVKADEALAELGDIDEQASADDTQDKPKGSIHIDTSREEIERLRNIITRQFSSIDDLKQTLLSQDLSAPHAEELAKKLEQFEVAQAQLNMCVETLEKENHRLNELLQSKNTDAGFADDPLEETREQLHRANERIDDLEQENADKTQRIEQLEAEIKSLEQQLQEREDQLKQAQLRNADISSSDNDEAITDPDILRQQIESINATLMRKSKELQKLQSSVSAAGHNSNPPTLTNEPDEDVTLFSKSEPDIATNIGEDDIPVLQTVVNETTHNEDTNTELDFGVDPEQLIDNDIIPINANAESIDQFDAHDIIMEDDYEETSIDDEVNAFLSGTSDSGSDESDINSSTNNSGVEDKKQQRGPSTRRDSNTG